MSSNDKAKEKLMESMRMTKASSDKSTETTGTAQNVKPLDDKPVMPKKKAVAKKAVAKKAVAKKATVTKKASTNAQKTGVNFYQTVRRVWPD